MRRRLDHSVASVTGTAWLAALLAHDLGYAGGTHEHGHLSAATVVPPLLLILWGLTAGQRGRLGFRSVVVAQVGFLVVIEGVEWLIGMGPAAGVAGAAIALAAAPLTAGAVLAIISIAGAAFRVHGGDAWHPGIVETVAAAPAPPSTPRPTATWRHHTRAPPRLS